MSQDAEQRVAMPATLLMVAGLTQLLSFGLWSLKSGVVLVSSLVSGGLRAAGAQDETELAILLGFSALGLVVEALKFIIFVGLLLLALLTVRGGSALSKLGSPVHARTGAVTAMVAPVIGLLSGLLSFMSLDCCGAIFGSVWAMFLIVVGVVAGSLTLSALGEDTVVDAMRQEV